MDNIETQCIGLFNNIKWDDVGKGKDYDYYFLLLIEFFRRVSSFSKTYNIDCEWPWDIIREFAPEHSYLSFEAKKIIESIPEECSFYQKRFVFLTITNFIFFERARYAGMFEKTYNNIYAPLIKIFESKGAFRSHHGFIEFGDFSQIPIFDKMWKREDQKPYIEFDEYF